MLICIFKNLFHTTILPVESDKQLRIYENGYSKLEYGSTLFIFKVWEHVFFKYMYAICKVIIYTLSIKCNISIADAWKYISQMSAIDIYV